MDIMGYKELVNSDEMALEDIEIWVRDIMNSFDLADRLIKAYDYKLEFKWKIFSDNIIISLSDSYDTDVQCCKLLRQLIILAADIQKKMLLEKRIIFRGSISKGEIFIDNNFVYGKGLIHAYELENEKAKYPRVIIDEDLLVDINTKKIIDKCIEENKIKHEEKTYFVNYFFSKGLSEKDDLNRIIATLITNYQYKKNETRDGVEEKLHWLKNQIDN